MKSSNKLAASIAIGLGLVGSNTAMGSATVTSDDGGFSTTIGGRIMVDAWAVDRDNDGTPSGKSGTEFRRARLFISGTMYDNWFYKGQYDFAGNGVSMKDAYIGYKGFDAFSIKIGNFKQPSSLEELTSSKYITFMERALPVEAFAVSRRIGLGIYNHSKHFNWAASIYGQGPGSEADNSEGYGAGARVAWSPINEKGSVIHLGASANYEEANDTGLRFRSHMENHGTSRYLDTGGIPGAEDATKYGLEAAAVFGPFSVQGEYFLTQTSAQAAGVDDPEFDGYYAFASWFLTGESRAYKKGAFGRVSPKSIVGKGGSGAWELAARYSYANLEDGGINGGEESNITIGLNWYATKYVRFMANYVMVDSDPIEGTNVDDKPNIIQARAQIDF